LRSGLEGSKRLERLIARFATRFLTVFARSVVARWT
jgi:hypothetical protein